MNCVIEMPVILDDFELKRCLDGVHSDRTEIADTASWSSMPLPQKFPERGSKGSKCTSRSLAASYMAKSRRAMGIMVNIEESARWTCSHEDIRNSASTTAILMSKHDHRLKIN